MKSRFFILISFLSTVNFLTLLGKEATVLIENGRSRVFTTSSIIYYGLDFSSYHLVNPNKNGIDTKLKKIYIPSWIHEFDETYSEKKMRKIFNVEEFVYNVSNFQINQQIKVNDTNLLIPESIKLGVDSIQRIVADYTITDSSGIGVAIIVEEYNKLKEEVSAYITFFDINSRELLYVVNSFGDARGTGMAYHWKLGLCDMWYNFKRYHYYYVQRDVQKQKSKQIK